MDTNLILLIIIIAVVLFFIQKNKSQKIENSNTEEINNITEESIFKAQNKFEEQLDQTYLPDAIIWKEIYIYKNLMAPWYTELSSKNRYDNLIIQKLREDWLEYMWSLQDRNAYNYLFMETEDKEKSDYYRNEHILASQKVFAIEDGFASAIWDMAKKELNYIRKLSWAAFSIKWDKAPKWYIYNIWDKLIKSKTQ